MKQKINNNMLKHEENLSSYATKSVDAYRLALDLDDIRPAYFRDSDRIMHALSYMRYADKTQVYSYQKNDHISKRIVHVQLVSKIARTIGRALNLNEDLIEAIALGHDIGHTPLGHVGETMLNEISKRELNEIFMHNVQSVRNYMEIENNGEGLNLTVQVLDGILCHNGEILSPIYQPVTKSKEQFLLEYKECYKNEEISKKLHPMTLEGCVVRVSDVIAYIGKDIEDAITLGLFDRKDLPEEIVKILGNNNHDIINNIILDIIHESMDKPYIKISDEVFYALNKLKNFNYQHIYNYAYTIDEKKTYQDGMEKLYQQYLNDILMKNKESEEESLIYTVFLNTMDEKYLKNTDPKRQVIDFLSGMTDEFFLRQIKK